MATKIRDNLYLGSFRDLSGNTLKNNGVTFVLNVASEVYEKPNNIQSEKIGIRDEWKEAKEFGPKIADRLVELLNSGETVFVHCLAGKSRSPHIVALALSRIECKSYNDIYSELLELRPQIMKFSLQEEIVNHENGKGNIYF